MTRPELEIAGILKLLEQSDFSTFVKQWMDLRQGKRGWSYTQLSRRCGFPSRAHCREILTGKRKLTVTSFKKLKLGLGLKGTIRQYFEVLAAQTNPHLLEVPLSPVKVVEKRLKLRERILAQYGHSEQIGRERVKGENFSVFASLSTTKPGRTLADVVRRSGLSRFVVDETLKDLVKEGLAVVTDRGRYSSTREVWTTQDVGKLDTFAGSITEALMRARASVQVNSKSKQHLFLRATANVPRHRLEELKTELQELLIDFFSDIDESKGDVLTHLVVAMGP